ncbi:hypothetical protein D9M70_583890 [compost metagenome]
MLSVSVRALIRGWSRAIRSPATRSGGSSSPVTDPVGTLVSCACRASARFSELAAFRVRTNVAFFALGRITEVRRWPDQLS